MPVIKPTTKLGRTRGFTLVELMTVSMILAMIMGAVLATFTMGNRSMQVADERVELHQTSHLVFSRFERELSSLWVPFPDPDPEAVVSVLGESSGAAGMAGDDASGLTGMGGMDTSTEEELAAPLMGEAGDMVRGESPRIEFLTVLPPEFGEERHRVDMVQLVYFVDTDEQTTEEGLIRGVNRYVDLGDADETTEYQEYCEHVTEFEIQYYDVENDDWVEEWDSQTPPMAILFSMTFDDDEDDEEPVILSGTVTPPRVLGATVGESFADTEGQATMDGEQPGGMQDGTGAGADEMDQLINDVAGAVGGP